MVLPTSCLTGNGSGSHSLDLAASQRSTQSSDTRAHTQLPTIAFSGPLTYILAGIASWSFLFLWSGQMVTRWRRNCVWHAMQQTCFPPAGLSFFHGISGSGAHMLRIRGCGKLGDRGHPGIRSPPHTLFEDKFNDAQWYHALIMSFAHRFEL